MVKAKEQFMTSKNDPGIVIERVDLLDCDVSLGSAGDEGPMLSLAIVALERLEKENNMLIQVGFDFLYGQENPAITFRCTFAAAYKREENSMAWDKFSDGIAVAHLIPYIREFASNITTRMPIPVLILPPVNAFSLVEDYKRREAKEANNVSE